MPRRDFNLASSFIATFPDSLAMWGPCKPHILIVVDGLTYRHDLGTSVTRFLEAITTNVAIKPELTLVSRFGQHPLTVTIGSDTYPITEHFHFDTANPPVTLANYDQMWLFGIGVNKFDLSPAEVDVIAKFMNGGGGVFATGDHERLGYALCGELPRIRHMRDWSSTPMGLESDASVAVNRIDTAVDPGANGVYEFEDQSDDIPQRIYPNYSVVDSDALGGTWWKATVHPLLMLPGAVQTRTTSAGFTKDLDVLPDHPHESVCCETPDAVLPLPYDLHGQNFPEYQPWVLDPTQRIKAEVVAYAVSGGRAIDVLVGSKPPVRPRMFPVITAYDGRRVQAYPGYAQRPGRIVCDSTWHHFVNINIDGTGSSRTGLGTGSGAGFVPGPHLLKIYAYYRNIVRWLMPSNRVWCKWWLDLLSLRYHPILIEELEVVERLSAWPAQVAIGKAAAQLLELDQGSLALDEMIGALLLNDRTGAPLADLFISRRLPAFDVDSDEIAFAILGGTLVKVARMLPLADREAAQAVIARGVDKIARELSADVTRLAGTALAEQARRANKRLALINDERLQPLMKTAEQ